MPAEAATDDFFDMYLAGARRLVALGNEYSADHAAAGISEKEWTALTNPNMWFPEHYRVVKTALNEAVTASMALAMIPPMRMPGEFVAAVIASVVAPCNRLIACTQAPETFNGKQAAGVSDREDIEPMTVEQLMGLVQIYSGDSKSTPQPRNRSKSP